MTLYKYSKLFFWSALTLTLLTPPSAVMAYSNYNLASEELTDSQRAFSTFEPRATSIAQSLDQHKEDLAACKDAKCRQVETNAVYGIQGLYEDVKQKDATFKSALESEVVKHQAQVRTNTLLLKVDTLQAVAVIALWCLFLLSKLRQPESAPSQSATDQLISS
jgi:hypothetical protein